MSLNFVGRRFGKYTILRFTGTQYECSCTCGRIEYVGVYAQINAGAIKALDQRKVKAAL